MPKDNHICDQEKDVKCLLPLTDLDNARIKDSLLSFIKNTSLIADSATRADCDSGKVWFDVAVKYGIIFRGRTDSFYVDSQGRGHQHDSQAPLSPDPTTRFMSAPIHIDPRHLDAMKTPFGKRAVLQMIYHEAGHAVAAWDHERTAGYATDSLYAVAGYPGSPYFRSVNSVGGGVCFQ